MGVSDSFRIVFWTLLLNALDLVGRIAGAADAALSWVLS